MSNVPNLAARRDKRAGKVEAFEIIRNAKPGKPISEVDLATLYSYFLPPPSRKITSVFDWVALACDINSPYAFTKFINVSNGMTVGANTKTAHICFWGPLEDGWYDVQGGPVGDDVAIMPDVSGALSEAAAGEIAADFDLTNTRVVDTPTGLAYVLPWCSRGVNKAYFDSAYGSLQSPVIIKGQKTAFSISGTVSGAPVCAVIMPFELPPMEAKDDEKANGAR